MSERNFIFCDICNTRGIRVVEERREINRGGGRRINDERAWFEGSAKEAAQQGWKTIKDEHFCPHCTQRLGHYNLLSRQAAAAVQQPSL